MQLQAFGLRYVETHREKINRIDCRVFCAETSLFDGSAAHAYVAIPVESANDNFVDQIRFEKTVPSSVPLTLVRWNRMPRVVTHEGQELC